MPIKIARNDIMEIEYDAIVDVADSSLFGVGGVDGASRVASAMFLPSCLILCVQCE